MNTQIKTEAALREIAHLLAEKGFNAMHFGVRPPINEVHFCLYDGEKIESKHSTPEEPYIEIGWYDFGDGEQFRCDVARCLLDAGYRDFRSKLVVNEASHPIHLSAKATSEGGKSFVEVRFLMGNVKRYTLEEIQSQLDTLWDDPEEGETFPDLDDDELHERGLI